MFITREREITNIERLMADDKGEISGALAAYGLMKKMLGSSIRREIEQERITRKEKEKREGWLIRSFLPPDVRGSAKRIKDTPVSYTDLILEFEGRAGVWGYPLWRDRRYSRGRALLGYEEFTDCSNQNMVFYLPTPHVESGYLEGKVSFRTAGCVSDGTNVNVQNNYITGAGEHTYLFWPPSVDEIPVNVRPGVGNDFLCYERPDRITDPKLRILGVTTEIGSLPPGPGITTRIILSEPYSDFSSINEYLTTIWGKYGLNRRWGRSVRAFRQGT